MNGQEGPLYPPPQAMHIQAPPDNPVLDRVLAVVFKGMTLIDYDKPELGLTYCDDLDPTDVLEALGYQPPYVDLVIPWSRHVGE